MAVTSGVRGRWARSDPPNGPPRFWWGFFLGLAVAAAGLLGALARLQTTGITVYVDANALEAQVQSLVAAHVRGEVSRFLAQVEAELPSAVSSQVARHLIGSRVQLGSMQLDLPAAVVDPIEIRLRSTLAAMVPGYFAGIDARALTDRITNRIRDLVWDQLTRNIAGVPLRVSPLPGLSIPVQLQFAPR